VLLCRCGDATLSLSVLAVVLVTGADPVVMPFVLASGLFLGGFLVRFLVLRPLSAQEKRATSAAGELLPALLRT